MKTKEMKNRKEIFEIRGKQVEKKDTVGTANLLNPITYQLTSPSVLKQCQRMAGYRETGKRKGKKSEYNLVSDAWPFGGGGG